MSTGGSASLSMLEEYDFNLGYSAVMQICCKAAEMMVYQTLVAGCAKTACGEFVLEELAGSEYIQKAVCQLADKLYFEGENLSITQLLPKDLKPHERFNHFWQRKEVYVLKRCRDYGIEIK